MEFQYLIDKIKSAPMTGKPFKHLEIESFFGERHFNQIVNDIQVSLREFRNDEDLINGLGVAGFEAIPFPGTTQSVRQYLKWHSGKGRHTNLNTCEGFGMTFRLTTFRSQLMRDVSSFFNSTDFVEAIAQRFEIPVETTYPDTGLQKYLDGYEISPHPDIRKKALTYMININPAPNSDSIEYHTQYMEFTAQRKYVEEFWRTHSLIDRCWVPWDWCTTVKRQTKNNSIVIFSPAHDTLHAVKANYDHLKTQRTQLYGNLWYKEMKTIAWPQWDEFEIGKPDSEQSLFSKKRLRRTIAHILPTDIKARIKRW